MSHDRLTRVNELLKREIAGLLYRLLTDVDFDISAVTVTRVVTSTNLRSAKIFVSIRDHEEVRGKMLRELNRNRRAMQQHIRKHITLKYIPQLKFELDHSIEEGDHILDLLYKLGKDDPQDATGEYDEEGTDE